MPRPTTDGEPLMRTCPPGVRRSQSIGIALALLAAVISGISVFVNGYAVREFPNPTLFTTLKNTIVGLALVVALLRPGAFGELRRLDVSHRLGLLLLGLLGGSVPFVLFFEGLARVTSGNAAFVQKTLFLWVALLAVLALRERLGIGQVLALGLLTVATLVLGGPGTLEMGAGAGMVLVATLLWSVEVIVAKRLLTSVGSSLAAAARMGVGAVVLLGYVSTQGGLGEIVDLAPAQWGWVGATGVLLLGYVITWYAALQRAPATTVTSVLTLGAPITAVLAVAAGRPAFGFEQFVGHLLLVAAAGILIMISARTDLLPRRQTPDLPIGLK